MTSLNEFTDAVRFGHVVLYPFDWKNVRMNCYDLTWSREYLKVDNNSGIYVKKTPSSPSSIVTIAPDESIVVFTEELIGCAPTIYCAMIVLYGGSNGQSFTYWVNNGDTVKKYSLLCSNHSRKPIEFDFTNVAGKIVLFRLPIYYVEQHYQQLNSDATLKSRISTYLKETHIEMQKWNCYSFMESDYSWLKNGDGDENGNDDDDEIIDEKTMYDSIMETVEK